MDAHLDLARRGRHARQESTLTARAIAPAAAGTTPRLGQGQRRYRTPSLVPPGPRADALVPRRAPGRRGLATPAALTPGRATSRRLDPRWYQIAMLSALLGYGVFGLHFDLGWRYIAGIIGAALGTQLLCTRLWRLPAFDPLSALISGLGLCTLLHTNGVVPAMLAAAIAIASKFILRRRGKHLFNPTNLALVVMLVAGAGWVSPGQYGHVAFVALLMVCLGLTVVCMAARSDVTLAFLGVWAAILFGRSLWLGEPMSIPVHRLQSGLLLQFAFNMISDPRTTPDSRAGRLLFGALVAGGTGVVQFVLFRTNGPLWSLAAFALAVPLIDRWLPGPRHQWNPQPATDGMSSKGEDHEMSVPALRCRVPVAVRVPLARFRP